MRRIVLAVTALAAALTVGSLAHRANSAPLGNPSALTGAAEDVAVVDSVHCRRGWRHHAPNRLRRADGCARRGGVIVVPGQYVIRDGVRVRVRDGGARTTIRSGSRTTIRTRTNINVRDGGGMGGGMGGGNGGGMGGGMGGGNGGGMGGGMGGGAEKGGG